MEFQSTYTLLNIPKEMYHFPRFKGKWAIFQIRMLCKAYANMSHGPFVTIQFRQDLSRDLINLYTPNILQGYFFWIAM